MNKSEVKNMRDWFQQLATNLGASGDGTRYYSNADLIPGTNDHSYGYYMQTKYGLLTFLLDVESGRNSTTDVMAKFLDTERLASAPISRYSPRDREVNYIRANGYSGKWNLHLGAVELDQAKQEISYMFDQSGLFHQDVGDHMSICGACMKNERTPANRRIGQKFCNYCTENSPKLAAIMWQIGGVNKCES